MDSPPVYAARPALRPTKNDQKFFRMLQAALEAWLANAVAILGKLPHLRQPNGNCGRIEANW